MGGGLGATSLGLIFVKTKISTFITELFLAYLKFELFVIIPTTIFDLVIGGNRINKFAKLFLDSNVFPFWLNLFVTLSVLSFVIVLFLYLFYRLLAKLIPNKEIIKGLSALVSCVISFMVFFVFTFGLTSIITLFVASGLAFIYGGLFIPNSYKKSNSFIIGIN